MSSSSELMDDDNSDRDGEEPGPTAPRGSEQASGSTLN